MDILWSYTLASLAKLIKQSHPKSLLFFCSAPRTRFLVTPNSRSQLQVIQRRHRVACSILNGRESHKGAMHMVLKSCPIRDRVLGTDQKESRLWDEIVNTMNSLTSQIICNDKVKVQYM